MAESKTPKGNFLKNLAGDLVKFNKIYKELIISLAPALKKALEISLVLKLEQDYEEFCEQHGWVPHRSVQNYLKCPSEDNQFDKVRVEWPRIRHTLIKQYADFGNGERKEVFNQILKTFTAGAPTIVVRAAITEIEGLSADFCRIHSKDTQSNRNSYVTNAPNHLGSMTPEDTSDLLPYKVMLDYSSKIFKSTEAHLHTSTSPVDPNFNRHANAHAKHIQATEFDALNAILLLHHYANYFSILDKHFKQATV